MRVAVVEDHRLMRGVIEKACAELGHRVVASVETGSAAVKAAIQERPDAILLDLMLPEMDGFEVVEEIRKKGCAPRILAISARCDAYTIYRVERAGFCGFMDKQISIVDDLHDALRAVSDGKAYFSATFRAGQLIRGRDKHSFDKVLTRQQQRILTMVGDLLTDPEIAGRLAISHETVGRHRRTIIRKLGLNADRELIRFARELGFMTYTQAQRP